MSRALEGKRIVSTRPEAQAREFVAKLREAGAIPIIFPTIQIAPLDNTSELDAALHKLDQYDWIIFTSVNGVRQVVERMVALHIPYSELERRQIAVIGPATGAALTAIGMTPALQPTEYIAESIVESLKALGSVAGKRILLLRASLARAALREQLVAKGALADEIPVYRTVRGEPDEDAYIEIRAGVDAITFTSSSTVHFFFDLMNGSKRNIGEVTTKASGRILFNLLGPGKQRTPSVIVGKAKIVCIGPITAKTAEDYGLHVDAMAEEYTVSGLIKALEALMSQEKN